MKNKGSTVQKFNGFKAQSSETQSSKAQSTRFKQIEPQIKQLCTNCTVGCTGYPEHICSAILALDMLTADGIYIDAKLNEIMRTNKELLIQAIESDFG